MEMEMYRPRGIASGIIEFLALLEKAEEQGGDAAASGDLQGPFFSRAAYGCVVKIGLESKGMKRKPRR